MPQNPTQDSILAGFPAKMPGLIVRLIDWLEELYPAASQSAAPSQVDSKLPATEDDWRALMGAFPFL